MMSHDFKRIGLVVCVVASALLAGGQVQGSNVGYWNFDEGTGTTAGDTSGNSLDGTLAADTTLPNWVAGRSGESGDYALNFIGGAADTGPQVDLGNPALLQITGSRSVAMWLNLNSLPASRYSLWGKAYDAEGTINILSDGSLQILWGSNSTGPWNSSPMYSYYNDAVGLTAGTWIYVAQVRDASTGRQRVYINGVAQTDVAFSLYNPTAASGVNQFIGTGYTASVDGIIDDVALFDEAVTDAQMASLYHLQIDPGRPLVSLDVQVPELYQLWQTYNSGPSSSVIIDGNEWVYTDTIPIGSHVLGESWTVESGLNTYTYLLMDLGTTSGLVFQFSVPEPSTLLLAGFGVLGLQLRRRRRRN